MHDIRFIREHPDAFDRALGRRNLSAQEGRDFSSQNVLSIDERRRAIIRINEGAQARRRVASEEIRKARAVKDEEQAQNLMAEVAALKETVSTTDAEQKAVQTELDDLLVRIPNLPLDDVPHGKDADDNIEHHRFGAKRNYTFAPKQHFDLGEALGQMDFETAAKLSGARFVVLTKSLARLDRALGQFFLDVHTNHHGYTEIAPPLLVRDEVMVGTGQLPKFEVDQFLSTTIDRFANIVGDQVAFDAPEATPEFLLQKLEASLRRHHFSELVIAWELDRARAKLALREKSPPNVADAKRWLIPTAEVPLTNLVRESILDEAQLPLRYTACTPCFRAEAGAAGKDTRGMIRQHQFTKVELVSITTPEQSKDEHERMLACAEEVLKRLDLHYRVMTLCTGDMGFAAQKTYDIEVWLPGQNAYREISSCSVCGDFQARRMNARYRTKEGRQVRHVHTLNGSGVAVGRALIAVMETYQQEDGSIAVPEALAPYMGGMKKIAKGESRSGE
jgi:seryl-tRNA synthetase